LPRSGKEPGPPRGRASTGDLSRLGVQDRRLERKSGAPYLVPGGLALAAALAAWLSWGRLASCAPAIREPGAQIREALAHQERAHLDDVYGFRAGGTAELAPVRYADVISTVDGARATVAAMLDAEGRVAWREQAARLSYVGRERFHMRTCSIALWCAEGDQFDRLRGVLLALFRRHDAAERGDPDALARLVAAGYDARGEDRAALLARAAREARGAPSRARVLAWQIRVDRDAAEVGEDLEVSREGAAARRERHVYRLVREGERWLFADGL
jgi:hypothetical protein